MKPLVSLCGVVLVLVTLVDIYLTVLYPRSGKGFLCPRLYIAVWRAFRGLSRLPWNTTRYLEHCGPMLLVSSVALWVCLLWVGFALVYWPALGNAILASEGSTPRDFVTALYFSGYNLTTLGVGDIVTRVGFYQMSMVFEAMLGFSVLTLSITYFMSVYSALIERNSFATSLHHRTVGTGDAVELLVRLGAGGNFQGATSDVSRMAQELGILFESHHSYPVLHYFRFRRPFYAMARIALVALDTASLIRTALDEEKHGHFSYSPAVAELWGVGVQMLDELSETLLPSGLAGEEKPVDNEQADSAQWRQRYYYAVAQLRMAGIATAVDEAAGAEEYIKLRRQWNSRVEDFGRYMLFNWKEIAPPTDCFDVAKNSKENK